jgi:hypothetical protein
MNRIDRVTLKNMLGQMQLGHGVFNLGNITYLYRVFGASEHGSEGSHTSSLKWPLSTTTALATLDVSPQDGLWTTVSIR